jgi:hypothetical protein
MITFLGLFFSVFVSMAEATPRLGYGFKLVESEGYGVTSDAAKNDACQNAVVKVVEEILESKVDDEISNQMEACTEYIENIKVVDQYPIFIKKQEFIAIDVEVEISTEKLKDKLVEIGVYARSLCTNKCKFDYLESFNDGSCDDGGPGSSTSMCDYGTDCNDCGERPGRKAEQVSRGLEGLKRLQIEAEQQREQERKAQQANEVRLSNAKEETVKEETVKERYDKHTILFTPFGLPSGFLGIKYQYNLDRRLAFGLNYGQISSGIDSYLFLGNRNKFSWYLKGGIIFHRIRWEDPPSSSSVNNPSPTVAVGYENKNDLLGLGLTRQLGVGFWIQHGTTGAFGPNGDIWPVLEYSIGRSF